MSMIQELPPEKRKAKPAAPVLIFAGNIREAMRYAVDQRFNSNDYWIVRHPRDLIGVKLAVYTVVRLGKWNLNFPVAQAWGYYLQRTRATTNHG